MGRIPSGSLAGFAGLAGLLPGLLAGLTGLLARLPWLVGL